MIIRNPFAIRPWQHVFEPLRGYIDLIERLYRTGGKFAESWNFGPDSTDTKTVLWIAKKITEIWGNGASFQVDPNALKLHEAHFLKLDCTKAKAKLNWHPKWNLETALERICDWHKACSGGLDMRKYSLNEIASYKLS